MDKWGQSLRYPHKIHSHNNNSMYDRMLLNASSIAFNDVGEIDGQKIYGHMDYRKKDPSLG